MPKNKSAHVFLVSGGARGITAQCVLRLAEQLPCNWILLGRSEIMAGEPDWAQGCEAETELKKRIMQDFIAQGKKPTPMDVNRVYRSLTSSREIRQTLQALRDLGSEVEYLSVDVTDAVALKAELNPMIEKFGPVTGIIHGAGNLADKLIEKKTPQDFDNVYGTKVKGLENLLSCVPVSQLKYLVLFSSVAGFYGNAGQADYALANEILNKTAHLVKQQNPDCHAIAINWGPWDSGMVTPVLKKAFEMHNILVLSVDEATQMLLHELSPQHQATTQVVIGSPLVEPVIELDGELKTHRIRRRLSLKDNPFLHDHMIAGNPVLPFTCAINWMSNTAEQLYPGYHCTVFEDIRVLKGLIFKSDDPEGYIEDFVVDLKETAKTPPDQVKVEIRIWQKTQEGKVRYHYSGQLCLQREFSSVPHYEDLNLTPDKAITTSGEDFYKNSPPDLFHGPIFRGVEEVINIDPRKITAKCVVRDIDLQQQGQFPVWNINPYISDVQTHAVWIWLQHFHQSGCLPAKLASLENFRPVPYNEPFYTSTEIKVKTETSLTVDIITHDYEGRIYSRILGAHATILPNTALQMAV